MSRPVIGFGEILFDLLPQGAQLGGAPANFAYHVSQLGGRGVAVSAVGQDELGAEVRRILDAKGLESVLADTPFPTGTVHVSLDAKGVPSYTIVEDVAWDNIPYTPAMRSLAREASAVCFGTLAQRSPQSRRTLAEFLADTPADCLKVYDINLRQHFYSRELVEDSLRVADVLKINDEELLVVAELLGLEGGADALCRALLEAYRLRLLILTRGADGSSVYAPDTRLDLACPDVKIADTVGAGDAFTAAFICAWLRGDALEDCHALAGRVAAFVCTKSGAMPDYADYLI